MVAIQTRLAAVPRSSQANRCLADGCCQDSDSCRWRPLQQALALEYTEKARGVATQRQLLTYSERWRAFRALYPSPGGFIPIPTVGLQSHPTPA